MSRCACLHFQDDHIGPTGPCSGPGCYCLEFTDDGPANISLRRAVASRGRHARTIQFVAPRGTK
jgi:hypothetical protein